MSCFEACLQPSGTLFAASADQPLLRSAADAGIELPSSCRNGTCRSCISLLLSGSVRYVVEWPGVLPEEKAQGWILPCVAYPVSNVVFMLAARQ